MIPKNQFYQEMRKSSLNFFPPEVIRYDDEAITFTEWLTLGYFNPLGVTSKTIRLSADKTDVAFHFYNEIELLINQCYEHIFEIANYSVDTYPRSDAWNVVTMYYLSFFTAQSMLRLLGRPIIFIDEKVTTILNNLCGSNFKSGTYSFTKINDESATHAEYSLKCLNGRPHDTVWNTLTKYFEELIRVLSNQNVSSTELLFYRNLLCRDLFRIYNTNAWPSSVRNKTNYRPGFAYKLFQREDVTKSKSLFLRWRQLDESQFINLLSNSLSACSLDKTFHSQVKVAHDYGLTLFVLMRSVYSDLISRRQVDSRWEMKRKQFLRRNKISDSGYGLILPN